MCEIHWVFLCPSDHEDGGASAVTGSTMPLAPVMETGEAGPPGTKLASRPPHGANGSMTPVKGYAGAPGGYTLLYSFQDVLLLLTIIYYTADVGFSDQ